jgi:hypothetical protein
LSKVVKVKRSRREVVSRDLETVEVLRKLRAAQTDPYYRNLLRRAERAMLDVTEHRSNLQLWVNGRGKDDFEAGDVIDAAIDEYRATMFDDV